MISGDKLKALRRLGFRDTPINIANLQSLTQVIPQEQRCGIYVLHFANGDMYVGQAYFIE